MKAIQVISVTLLCVLAANAQVIKPGRCPQPAVQQNFDPTMYMGKWYEIQKLPNIFQSGQCGTAQYHLKAPGVVGVLNSELLADGSISSATGTAKVVDPSEPAKLEVSFFEHAPAGPYWVLSSDYNHSLVYGCRNLGSFHSEYTWILYREPVMPEETLEEMHSILNSIGGSVDKLLTTDHDEVYCRPMFE